MSLIDRIVDQEAAWLARQEGQVLTDMLDVYKGTLAEIKATIGELEPFSYSHNQARAIESQLEAMVASMGRRQSEMLGDSVSRTYKRALRREVKTLARMEHTYGDAFMAQQFRGFKPIVPQRTIKKLLITQDIAIRGLTDAVTRDVRKLGIARSLTKGEGTFKTVARLKKLDIPLRESRLHLIARMENARAGNEAKTETLKQMSKEHSLDLWQMFRDHVERSAKTRNHWISWALSGTVRNVAKKEYFEVHLGELSKQRAAYKAITGEDATDSGILMEEFPQGLRTKGGVAHFWERGVIIPWRPKWGGEFGQIKHPQGPIDGYRPEEEAPPPKPAKKEDKPKKTPAKPKKEKGSTPGALANVSTKITAEEGLAKAKEIAPRLKAIEDEIERIDKGLYSAFNEGGRETLRKMVYQRKDKQKELKAVKGELHALLFASKPSKFELKNRIRFKKTEASFKRDIADGEAFIRNIIGEGVLDNKTLQVVRGEDRAFYENGIISIPDALSSEKNVATVIHEAAHWFEEQSEGVLEKAASFWARRTKGEKFLRLRDVTPYNYKPEEMTKKDDFLYPYMGKVYYKYKGKTRSQWKKRFDGDGWPPEEIRATELISMGLEKFYENPIELIQDEDYFKFIWGVVKNVQRKT